MSERARSLQAEIQRLESQIQDLSRPVDRLHGPAAKSPAQADKPQPRLRSTALPGGQVAHKAAPPTAPPRQVFEELDHARLQAPPEAVSKSLYNELGVRRYDLPGAWERLKNHFKGTATQNQTFVKLLAAGNIQGLRPLRYEKRVARLRFVFFVVGLLLLLWGIIARFVRH